VLLWVYYSSLIFFFGAEFTQVYAREYGSGLLPAVDTEATAAQPEKRPTGGKRTLNL
jgi:membrane protein